MSKGGDTRFKKGQSGNPAGRPKRRRPNVSAFDIIFDKVLTVNQDGQERELSVDEALQQQTFKDALAGSKMAIRQVLKMIEKREVALAKRYKPPVRKMTMEHEAYSENAEKALRILGITEPASGWGDETSHRMRIATWATQAALSRSGKRKFLAKDGNDIEFFTQDSDQLKWPRGAEG
uniref:DUF5681 domain-containing protein n=1 Tax=uncultured Erythrobacter sp. TaxID=263913 RepID=UPI0026137DA4|nr:DUF5681 domain-containing protein [uncultured Erythrobacter sp.]